jgi:protein-tyrosine kinase
MDLRKSIEKAKKIREAGEPTDGATRPVPASTPKDPWQAPTYSQSIAARLDAAQLSENRIMDGASDMQPLEAYKVLRAQILQRTRENGSRVIMITSASPGEGKTLTSINLSMAMAKEFSQTVLLVDADLRRQAIHRYLGIDSRYGLFDYIVNDRPMRELILWPGVDKFTLISGGRHATDSAELLSSPKMRTLVQEMKKRYEDRYILFDCPPLLSGADTLSFAPLVDAIIMVVQSDRTAGKAIMKALELIPKEKFLGFIMNRCKKAGNGYYYG